MVKKIFALLDGSEWVEKGEDHPDKQREREMEESDAIEDEKQRLES